MKNQHIVGGHLEKFIKSHTGAVIDDGGGEAFEVRRQRKKY